MKRYTPHYVMNKMVLAGAGQTPHPFPGKTPTRVWWVVKAGEKVFEYLGKPSMNAFFRFTSLARRMDVGYSHFKEFDTRNVIAEMVNSGRIGRVNLGYTRHNRSITTFFRPMHPGAVVPGSTKLYAAKISNHWVYSPYEKPPLEYIEAHTRWLRDMGW